MRSVLCFTAFRYILYSDYVLKNPFYELEMYAPMLLAHFDSPTHLSLHAHPLRSFRSCVGRNVLQVGETVTPNAASRFANFIPAHSRQEVPETFYAVFLAVTRPFVRAHSCRLLRCAPFQAAREVRLSQTNYVRNVRPKCAQVNELESDATS
jgi:hypothetical protein